MAGMFIFIKNNTEAGYVNGTTGTVESFSPIDNMPIVRTTEGLKIKLDMEEWSLENDSGKVTATVSQVPLRLAWAITIHKSQGMNIDNLVCNVDNIFAPSQFYVAISRAVNPKHLKIDFNKGDLTRYLHRVVHVDQRVVDYYKGLDAI